MMCIAMYVHRHVCAWAYMCRGIYVHGHDVHRHVCAQQCMCMGMYEHGHVCAWVCMCMGMYCKAIYVHRHVLHSHVCAGAYMCTAMYVHGHVCAWAQPYTLPSRVNTNGRRLKSNPSENFKRRHGKAFTVSVVNQKSSVYEPNVIFQLCAFIR